MLAIFRNNETSSIFLLAVYVGLLRLPALLGLVPPVPCAAEGASVAWMCHLLSEKPFWSAVTAATLVFVQAILLNNLDQKYRLAPDRTWLPGMVYALVASALPQFLYLTPPLFALTFILMGLNQLFGTYKQQVATGAVFDSAFWVMVGALCYPPVLLLLVAAFIGLSVLRSFNFRERVVFFSGAMVPLFLGWLWFFWHDEGGLFWQKQFGSLFGFLHFDTSWDAKSLMQIALMLFLTLFVLLNFGAYYHKKLIQVQKYISIFYWFLFVGGLSALLQNQLRMEHLLLLAPTVALFLSLSFVGLRNRGLAEILHFALLGLVFFLMFFPV